MCLACWKPSALRSWRSAVNSSSWRKSTRGRRTIDNSFSVFLTVKSDKLSIICSAPVTTWNNIYGETCVGCFRILGAVWLGGKLVLGLRFWANYFLVLLPSNPPKKQSINQTKHNTAPFGVHKSTEKSSMGHLAFCLLKSTLSDNNNNNNNIWMTNKYCPKDPELITFVVL